MMRVLLVRHGEAMAPGDAAAAGLSDESRPLTREGAQHLARAAARLKVVEPTLHAVLASPFERAVQSAEIVANAYGIAAVTAELLRPGTSAAAVDAGIARFAGSLALVGHAPDVGLIAGWWLCGTEVPLLHFGKGTIGAFDFEAVPGPAAGRLRYLVPETVLRC